MLHYNSSGTFSLKVETQTATHCQQLGWNSFCWRQSRHKQRTMFSKNALGSESRGRFFKRQADLREWWIWDKEGEQRTNKRDVLPRGFISCGKVFLQLMKPLRKTYLLFGLCSSFLSHIHHSLKSACLSKKKYHVFNNINVFRAVGGHAKVFVKLQTFSCNTSLRSQLKTCRSTGQSMRSKV